MPVAPTVPTVNLVPPAFPVTMSVPPPGYSGIPPPPFLRASFNPSQPPPGKFIFPFYNINIKVYWHCYLFLLRLHLLRILHN